MTLPAEFSSFLSEFDDNISEIKSLLSSIADHSNEKSQRELLKRASTSRDDCINLITSISPSVRHYSYNQRTKCQKKLRECEEKLDEIAKLLGAAEFSIRTKKVNINNNNARSELITAGLSEGGKKVERSADQRERLLNVRSLMDEGDEALRNTESLIAESIDIGANTQTTLIMQREQFAGQLDSLKVTDENLTVSDRTMRRVGWRILTNRIFAIVVIIALMTTNGIVIWLKYFH